MKYRYKKQDALVVKAHLRDLDTREKRFVREVRGLLDVQEAEVLANLTKLKDIRGIIKRGVEDIGVELFNFEESVLAFAGFDKRFLSEALQHGALNAFDDGLQPEHFDDSTPTVSRYLETQSTKFGEKVNDSTRRQLARTLGEIIADGGTLSDAANEAHRVYEFARDVRAFTMARTEIGSALNFGKNEQYRQTKRVVYKRWITVLDGRERPAHERAHGQTRRKENQFRVGGEWLEYPRDPHGSPENIINCRCTITARRTKPTGDIR